MIWECSRECAGECAGSVLGVCCECSGSVFWCLILFTLKDRASSVLKLWIFFRDDPKNPGFSTHMPVFSTHMPFCYVHPDGIVVDITE